MFRLAVATIATIETQSTATHTFISEMTYAVTSTTSSSDAASSSTDPATEAIAPSSISSSSSVPSFGHRSSNNVAIGVGVGVGVAIGIMGVMVLHRVFKRRQSRENRYNPAPQDGNPQTQAEEQDYPTYLSRSAESNLRELQRPQELLGDEGVPRELMTSSNIHEV